MYAKKYDGDTCYVETQTDAQLTKQLTIFVLAIQGMDTALLKNSQIPASVDLK